TANDTLRLAFEQQLINANGTGGVLNTNFGLASFASGGTLTAAIHTTHCQRSERTFQRIWNRFDRRQSAIRTALLGRGPPVPPLPAEPSRRPTAAQVLAHLQATFPHTDCPIAAFQLATRSFFL
ncbi:MAG: hypothetical protein K2P78_10730, partial [Gemmataceae bacterium]|nr:hypothetical protein [Gemmataceae bacterium]